MVDTTVHRGCRNRVGDRVDDHLAAGRAVGRRQAIIERLDADRRRTWKIESRRPTGRGAGQRRHRRHGAGVCTHRDEDRIHISILSPGQAVTVGAGIDETANQFRDRRWTLIVPDGAEVRERAVLVGGCQR